MTGQIRPLNLTIQQLSQVTDIHVQTLYKWYAKGLIQGSPVGVRKRVPISEAFRLTGIPFHGGTTLQTAFRSHTDSTHH